MRPPPLVLALFFAASTMLAADVPKHLYVPDGQLLSMPVKVYVSSVNLDRTMNPSLQLPGFKAHGRVDLNAKEWEPFIVAPDQTWTEKVEGQSVERQGTLLIFDLNQFELAWYESTPRVTPVLSWQPPDLKEGNPKPMLVGQPVYLGRRGAATLWTLGIVGAVALLIAILAGRTEVGKIDAHGKLLGPRKSPLYLISGPDGYMSLWRTQLVAWTLAVGGMVFLFGIIQLDVPRIPESLVTLMGMSVATGALSAIAGKPKSAGQATAKAKADAHDPDKPAHTPALAEKPRWKHLISSYDPHVHTVVLSVPKAQMVFWTGVILVLFVFKSWLSGQLWEVPWELVTLTGVSQAGYVGDKALQKQG